MEKNCDYAPDFDYVTSPGSEGTNEDRTGAVVADGYASFWAVDGATDLYTKCYPGGENLSEWLASKIDVKLSERFDGADRDLMPSIEDVVAELRDDFRAAHTTLDAAFWPIATILAVEISRAGDLWSGSFVALGDCSLVLRCGGQIRVLHERRETRAEKKLKNAVRRGKGEHDLLQMLKIRRREQNSMQRCDFISLSENAKREYTSQRLSFFEPFEILLLTDGASRIVDEYHQLDWQDVFEIASKSGARGVISTVRQFEENIDNRILYKKSDDASVSYITSKK